MGPVDRHEKKGARKPLPHALHDQLHDLQCAGWPCGNKKNRSSSDESVNRLLRLSKEEIPWKAGLSQSLSLS